MSTEPSPSPTASSRFARRSDLPVSVLLVGAIVLLLLGFATGLLAHAPGGGDDRSARPRFDAARGHRAFPGYPTGGWVGHDGTNELPAAPAAGTVVAGTVTSVRGSAFSLRTFTGATVRVRTDRSTFVRLMGGSSLASLRQGSVVFVSGRPAPDGTLTATRVLGGFPRPATDLPAAATPNA